MQCYALHAGVGTIVKSASGKFKEGQRVVSAGKWNGTWQEFALADESSLVRHYAATTAPLLPVSPAACKPWLALLRSGSDFS